MRNTSVPDYVPLVLLVALLAFWAFSAWQLRRRVASIFNPQDTNEEELARINHQLESLNERCVRNSFSAQRLAHITFLAHDVLLVYGRVTAHGAKGPYSQMSIYALGEGDDAEWMRRFSDIFELAFTYSGVSVFWVKLGTLMRLTRRCSQPLAAPRSSLR